MYGTALQTSAVF